MEITITRDELIERMKLNKIAYASVYSCLTDKLASLYHLTSAGKLVDYGGKAVPKAARFEGWMDYDRRNGIIKIPFQAEETNIG